MRTVSDAKRLHSCRKRKQLKPTTIRAKREHKGRYVLLRPDGKRAPRLAISVATKCVCVVVVPFAKMQQPSNPVTAAAVRYKEGHHKDVHVCVSTSLRCSGWPVDVVVVPISTGECHIYTPNGKQQ